MAPLVSMPTGPEATRLAALTELRQSLRAVSCGVALLARRGDAARDEAIVREIRRSLRRAAAAIRRLPSPPTP